MSEKRAYERYPSETVEYKDRISGVTVRQLTSYLGHSHHTYFTNNGWWDHNRRLVFQSDRANASNLFSIEISTGEISRLTDFGQGQRENVHFANDVNQKRNEIYFIKSDGMYSLNLETLKQHFLYQAPRGFHLHGGLTGADGDYVYATLGEDLSDRVYANLSASYVGMRDVFYARPDTRIIRIHVESGNMEELWQENCWIGHVNPSPTQPTLLTFCHEGPWDLVDHRIWVMDTENGTPYPLRKRKVEGEKIGHEYWFANGEQIGYQVHTPDHHSYFGFVRFDGSGEMEAPCVPFKSPDHIHSNDFKLIVSDSGKAIKLYRYNGTDFDCARVLCMHDGSFFYGSHHPHPRFCADGKQILYNSNVSGYCNLYLADVPEDVTMLPEVENTMG